MPIQIDKRLSRQFITSEDVRSVVSRGESHLPIPNNCTVTDEARELALKLSVRLGDVGLPKSTQSAGSSPPRVPPSPNSAADQPSWPEDTNRRITEAASTVLKDLGLMELKATLLPIIVRRVFAGLAANRGQ